MTTASRPATPSENRIVKILMPNARRTRAQHFARASHSSQALIGASSHILLWYYFQPPCYIASRSSPVVVASIIKDASGVGGSERMAFMLWPGDQSSRLLQRGAEAGVTMAAGTANHHMNRQYLDTGVIMSCFGMIKTGV